MGQSKGHCWYGCEGELYLRYRSVEFSFLQCCMITVNWFISPLFLPIWISLFRLFDLMDAAYKFLRTVIICLYMYTSIHVMVGTAINGLLVLQLLIILPRISRKLVGLTAKPVSPSKPLTKPWKSPSQLIVADDSRLNSGLLLTPLIQH